MLPEIKVRVTADTDQAEAGLKRVEAGLKSTDAAAKRAGAGLTTGAAQLRAYGQAAQVGSHHTANLTANFNDIGVMLAAGQSPLMLAMQQGTQVSQVLNQMGGTGKQALQGIMAGLTQMVNPLSLATLAIIAGGAALVQWGMSAWDAESDTRTFDDSLEGLEAVMGRIDAATRLLSMSAFDLSDKYGILAGRVRELATEEAILAEGAASRALQETVSTLDDVIAKYAGATRSGRDYRNAINRINSELGLGSDEAVKFARALQDMATASGPEEQIDAANRLRDVFEQNNIEIAKLPPEIQDAISKANALEMATINVEAALSRAAQAGADLSASLPMTTGIGLSPDDPNLLPPPRRPPPVRPTRPGRSGGGGSARDPAIEALINSLKTEDEILTEWREEGLTTLAEANAKELEVLGGHAEAKLRLEEEYQRRLSDMRGGYHGDGLAQAQTFFGEMAMAMQGGSEKMLRIAKVFGAAESLVNSYRAYTAVLADPSLPWFARVPAAVSVLSAGLGMVSAIKGVSAGGGASAGAAAAGASAAPAAPVERRVAEFRFVGGNVLDPRAIVDAMNDAYDQGYQIKGVLA